MRSEFGLVPPAFLPTGSGCLYELQLASPSLALGRSRYITLPSTYTLSPIDARKLEDLEVTPLFLDEEASVVKALIKAVEIICPPNSLRVLFGDTLISMTDEQHGLLDAVAIKGGRTNHDWLYVDPETMIFSDQPPTSRNESFVSCGYYSFSDPELLVSGAHRTSFRKTLEHYNSKKNLTCFEPSTWLDFGHVSLFYQSKKSLLVSRSFNAVKVQGNVLSKFSSDTRKIRAEANWFSTLPAELELHCPRFMGETSVDGRAGYSLEYMHLPTLSDLFTLSRLPSRSWSRMFNSVADYLRKCQELRPESSMPEAQASFADRFYTDLVQVKSYKRLNDFITGRGFDQLQKFTVNGVKFPDLMTVLEQSLLEIPTTQAVDISRWHGDLFFGNMLYDIRSERVICLDPRGLVGADHAIYGDIRYDLAKLAHSVYGKYDLIIGNRYSLRRTAGTNIDFIIDEIQDQQEIEDLFELKVLNTFSMSKRQSLAFCSVLFLSMLSLHSDDVTRQDALLATALQCYEKWNQL